MKCHFDVKTHLVCYIDLLGQKALFEKNFGDKIFINMTEEIQNEVNSTSSSLLAIKQRFAELPKFLEGHSKLNSPDKNYDSVLQRLSPKVQQMSDTIMVYIQWPTASPDDCAVFCHIMIILFVGLSRLWIAALKNNIPLRGAMTLGPGWELDDELPNLYGPVIAKASQLEAHIANYPRLLLSDDFVNEMKDVYSNALKCQICSPPSDDWISRDFDGCWILHYLDKRNIGLLKEFGDFEEQRNLLCGAYQKAISEYRRYSEESAESKTLCLSKKVRLATKYNYLAKYLGEGLAHWDASLK